MREVEKIIKIQCRYQFRKTGEIPFSEIRISGQWLEELGFLMDERIVINGHYGLLVIRALKENESRRLTPKITAPFGAAKKILREKFNELRILKPPCDSPQTK